ncbi:hypothetical protein [Sphingobacterium multivorum]|nr:hypothetical protein [Sphingobacterium multivorum]
MSSRRNFIKQGLIAATTMGTFKAFDAKGLAITAKAVLRNTLL